MCSSSSAAPLNVIDFFRSPIFSDSRLQFEEQFTVLKRHSFICIHFKNQRETIEIGQTDFTKNEIDQIIMLLGREFRGIDYHLINKNCNVFASKFSKVSVLKRTHTKISKTWIFSHLEVSRRTSEG